MEENCLTTSNEINSNNQNNQANQDYSNKNPSNTTQELKPINAENLFHSDLNNVNSINEQTIHNKDETETESEFENKELLKIINNNGSDIINHKRENLKEVYTNYFSLLKLLFYQLLINITL